MHTTRRGQTRLEHRIEHRQRECAQLREQIADPHLNENQKRYRRQRLTRLEREISELEQTLQTRASDPIPLAPEFIAKDRRAQQTAEELEVSITFRCRCPECGNSHRRILKPNFYDFAE
jgi:deoxyribodipyrimidine photolyase